MSSQYVFKDLSILLIFFFFFFNPKQAVKLLAPASGAGPGCSRARIGRWSGQGRVLVVQSCLWSPAGVGLVTRTVGQEVCSFRLLVKHPQFSQQLCSSLSFGRHRNVLKMTFFVSFSPPSPFSMKAIAFWLLSIQEFVKPFHTCSEHTFFFPSPPLNLGTTANIKKN